MLTDLYLPPALQAILITLISVLSIKIYGKELRAYLQKLRKHDEIKSVPSIDSLEPDARKKVPSEPIDLGPKPHEEPTGGIHLYKELYFKLQNLEQYPEILIQCRDLLISLFNETLAEAIRDKDPGILSVDQYSPESLECFMQSQNDKTTNEWERYVSRRRAGSPPEMFRDREEAAWWLRQIAPVKYVDGAWLGHINKITTPFNLRRATKDAWQVMSEELGDGNPHMNHVYVYRELMKEIGAGLPEASELDFIDARHDLNEECVWKAAVSQLLISLFPHEFLPEILGFNLHFEGLTMETMKAAKELEDLRLNPYYFILHISIDNADSGHTAIAMQAVIKYLNAVLQERGREAVHHAWRRVQVGYILSQGLSAAPQCPSQRQPALNSFPRDPREAEVIRIFKSKAPVAHRIHCGSRIKFGGRKLDEWLEPYAFASKQWQMDFLKYLSNLKPWVRKGDSNNSKLIQELSWGGKMFGSFTQSEVEIVKQWIDELGHTNPKLYWNFVGLTEVRSEHVIAKQDIRTDYPVLSPVSLADLSIKQSPLFESPLLKYHSATTSSGNPDMSILLPLWFTTPCLLECLVCIPAKTTSIASSSVVRLLRAQNGFDAEGWCVAGMDEARRSDPVGLVELGLEMMKNLGLAQPASLKDVLETWPSEFALKMLEMSVHPMANRGLLLGLAWAFVGLHDVMTSSILLSNASKSVLMQIVRRQRDCLEVCFKDIKDDKARSTDFYRGYGLGTAEIRSCFGQKVDIKEEFPPKLLS